MEKIRYNKDLSRKQREYHNFIKASSKFIDYGFATYLFPDDSNGADFLAIHLFTTQILKIQLKARFTLAKKYVGKDIWILYPNNPKNPDDDEWYLYPHDKLVEDVKDIMPYHKRNSWKEKGVANTAKPSKKLQSLLDNYTFDKTLEKI